MGALLERLPPPSHTAFPPPLITRTPTRMSRQDIAAKEGVVAIRHVVVENKEEQPMRVLKEADSREDTEKKKKVPTPQDHYTTIVKPQGQAPINQQEMQPKIPNVLLFTHAVNLLDYSEASPNTSNQTKEEIAELLALKQNVEATIAMHPNAQVRFLTDADCIQSIKTALGDTTPLVDYFQKENQGMYKADICRGAALWETGGLYLDVDVGVRMSLPTVLNANTTFATSLVHRDSKHLGSFFQAFMATTPRHAILKQYLQLFLDHYQGKNPVQKGPLGVILLRRAFDEIVLSQQEEVLTINGEPTIHNKKQEKHSLGPKTLDTQHYGRIQLWQEVLYNPKLFPNVVPAPTWGTRRACHFLVVANRQLPLTVPLYSRVAGSRMCPGATTPAKDEKEKKAKLVETKKG